MVRGRDVYNILGLKGKLYSNEYITISFWCQKGSVVATVSFSSSLLPVFIPGAGRRESFDIMQHRKDYATESDLLDQ